MHQKPHIIAEIGINHNGDINIAKKLIDMSKKLDAIQQISKEILNLYIQKRSLIVIEKVLGVKNL